MKRACPLPRSVVPMLLTVFLLHMAGAARGDGHDPEGAPDTLHGPRSISNLFFGVTVHSVSEENVPVLHDLNINTVRIDFPEVHLNRPDMPYHVVLQSADRGVRENIDQLAMSHGAGDSPERTEQYAFDAATKYKGQITHWQAGNEPWMPRIGEAYVEFLKAFYSGIKRADPANKVVLAGFAGFGYQHLEEVYRLGGKDYFDIMAAHPYTRPRMPEEGGFLDKLRSMRDVMRKYGDDKPLWITEMGWNGVEPSMLEYLRAKNLGYRGFAGTEEGQARGLARMFLISATVPWLERVYFFNLIQSASYTDHERDNADAFIGVMGPGPIAGHLRPKDAYYAFRTVIRMIDNSRYVERIDMGQRIWALVFQRDEAALIALWSLDDDVDLTLEDTSMIKGVTSLVGTPIRVMENRLRLSGRPIYVAVGLKDLDSLKEEIRQADITGLESIQVSVGLDLEKTRPGQPVLDIQFNNTARSVAPAPRLHLDPDPPWKAQVPVIIDDDPLDPGETRRYPVPMQGVAAAAGEVAMNLRTIRSGPAGVAPADHSIHYLVVPPRPERFQADGSLEEWQTLQPVILGIDPKQRELPNWGGTNDCSAAWYCAWDDDALYFAAEVRDDRHHQTSRADGASDMMWMRDSIQIAIDMEGDAVIAANVTGYDGLNDAQFGLALGSDQLPVCHVWFQPEDQTGLTALKQLAIVRDGPAKVTRYEVAMPWPALGFKGSPAGKWMGLNVLINDNDGQGRKGWLEWSPGIGYSVDPGLYPKVWLAPRQAGSHSVTE